MKRPRWVRSRRTGGPARLSSRIAPKLPAKGAAFFRGHLFPALSHVLSLVRRQRVEPATGVTDRFTLLGGEIPEALKPFPDMLLLIRRQLLPLLEPLPSLRTFLGIHVGPLTGAVPQTLLPLGRQLIPLIAESLQDFLLSLT